jgi:hypothetical protein
MERQNEARGSAGFSEALAERVGIQFAGLALTLGLDPLRILDCHDPVEMAALEAVVAEADRLRALERQDIANRLADVMAKILV